MITITLVKKIKADGSPCRKCNDVLQRLRNDGVYDRIDRIITADERDPDSEGMRIAVRHGVEQAPFFVIEREDAPAHIYTIYMRFLRDVMQLPTDERDEATEVFNTGTIDFL